MLEPDVLVRYVMRRNGVDPDGRRKWAELADALDMKSRSAPLNLKRWATSENGPRYGPTLFLLGEAGLLPADVLSAGSVDELELRVAELERRLGLPPPP